jgi:predicted transcriptional regulator
VRKKTSIRLSETGELLQDRLAEKLGISKSAVLEQALRLLAEREGVRNDES